MGRVKDVLDDFASLHEGGAIALVKDRVRPHTKDLTDEIYKEAIAEHLGGDVPIGVYPLWERNNVWMVSWVAVDLDEGDLSSIHADNLITLLDQMSIKAWKEPSRSKGYHVWVYLKEALSAQVARKGMIGACRTVDVPIREVYPKQVKLEKGKIGNCLRLPYPKIRDKGRQVVEGYTLEEFTKEAMANRTPPGVYRKLMQLHRATEPAKLKQVSAGTKTDGQFYGSAQRIWDNPTLKEDRSATLFSFACSLLWQEYSIDATVDWVRRLDDRLEKFTDRDDREQRIRDLVDSAARKKALD
tara:strand:- start:2817 stop:3713 length:897 start_codon:yes stop_codon:yes gene_type:complete